jgi:hypothetical protein
MPTLPHPLESAVVDSRLAGDLRFSGVRTKKLETLRYLLRDPPEYLLERTVPFGSNAVVLRVADERLDQPHDAL